MKFLVKIAAFLIFMVINFALYLLLFLSMAGMKPQQSILLAKEKFGQVQADSSAVENKEVELSEEMKREVAKAREIIANEKGDLEAQKTQLLNEKSELEKLRSEIKNLMAAKKKADEDRMYNLAKIYDGMDQEKVAEVFGQMDDSLIVAILPKMKPGNSSQVLEFLPPQRSAKISKLLLEGA